MLKFGAWGGGKFVHLGPRAIFLGRTIWQFTCAFPGCAQKKSPPSKRAVGSTHKLFQRAKKNSAPWHCKRPQIVKNTTCSPICANAYG